MSVIRDYLNLGLHRGLEGCVNYNDGKWDPAVFKRWSANLSGEVEVLADGSAAIYNYPTNQMTADSLHYEMSDLCSTLGVNFVVKKKVFYVVKVQED